MKRYVEQAEQRVNSLQVTQDEYEHWKNNKVTQRLMADLELILLESNSSPIGAGGVEVFALNAMARNQHQKDIEEILEWKPQELITDE